VTSQQQSRLYWKDALRQAQIEIEATEDVEATDLSSVHNRKWANAYRQARLDLEDPSAVVWLPDEIVDVIRQTDQEPSSPPSQPRRQRLTALLLVVLLLVPAAVSYVLAYRRITAFR